MGHGHRRKTAANIQHCSLGTEQIQTPRRQRLFSFVGDHWNLPLKFLPDSQLPADHAGIPVCPMVSTDGAPESAEVQLHPATFRQPHSTFRKKDSDAKVLPAALSAANACCSGAVQDGSGNGLDTLISHDAVELQPASLTPIFQGYSSGSAVWRSTTPASSPLG